jgi:hypothetical protein
VPAGTWKPYQDITVTCGKPASAIVGTSAKPAERLSLVLARARSLPATDLRDFTFMLSNFGVLAGRYATPVVVPPAVAILGAGIAGAALARALKCRGIEAEVFDPAPGPASGASGNPLALLMPRLDAGVRAHVGRVQHQPRQQVAALRIEDLGAGGHLQHQVLPVTAALFGAPTGLAIAGLVARVTA